MKILSLISVLGSIGLLNAFQDGSLDLVRLDKSVLGGFREERSSVKFRFTVLYARIEDGVHLRVDGAIIPTDIDVTANWVLVSTPQLSVPDRPTAPRSGLPLGEQCFDNYDHATGAGGQLCVLSGRVIVGVLLRGGSTLEGDLALQEGAARYAIAKFRGLETRSTGDATVNGKSIDDCRRTDSGIVLVPLDKWATATGVEITWNKVRGTAMFSHGGESYIFPLGATKLKKGGKWWDCGETLSWYGGHWYAPLSLLN